MHLQDLLPTNQDFLPTFFFYLLELALNYTLPKLAHTYNEVDNKQKTFRVEYVPSLEEKDNS